MERFSEGIWTEKAYRLVQGGKIIFKGDKEECLEFLKKLTGDKERKIEMSLDSLPEPDPAG
jgi:tRNA G46 methylase TrmB